MMQLKNDRLLRAIWHEPTDITPIWIMRQAGRYLPEYRKLREKAGSFMRLCKTPELACEVTLQPLARFSLDAAILFSDILTIPDAMGLKLNFKEGSGPFFENPLTSSSDILKLKPIDAENQLSYVFDSIHFIQQELAGSVPLIGFCGSPWTLATYMVDADSFIQDESRLLHHLLDVLADSVSRHLNAQIKAGVDVVMIFDTWGGVLNLENYQTFSLYYIKQVAKNLIKEFAGKKIPFILFMKNGKERIELMKESGCHVIGLDGQINLQDAKKRVGNEIALQGNLDPAVLKESPQKIRTEVARILKEFGKGSGHIFNLGHGITPDILPEQVAILVDAVHELSREYHDLF